MNRIETAEFLEICRGWFEPYTSAKNKWHEALDMAIEALQEPLVNEDCISRVKILEMLNVMMSVDRGNVRVYLKVFSQIKDAPSVVSTERTGEWVIHGDPPWYVRECSKCGEKWFHHESYKNPKYCGNCGCKVKG